MGFLFKSSSAFDKLKDALKLARDHGLRLAAFVFIYKTIVGVIRIIRQKTQNWHAFVGGCIGGFFVFRKWNPINAQIVMYLVSRNLLGIAGRLRKLGYFPKSSMFTYLAVVCWGVVMLIYDINSSVLQKSLTSSMNYLYKETNSFTGWRCFIPFMS